ncbi:hypothetical protein ACWD8I_03620 [Micromonospora arida]|uniref:hypothetical protein n=1 Tax=Micromonospora arida TaxID=2203715 RepID=UPI0033DC5ABF
MTNTALYLYEAGIDIRLVRYQLYRTAGGEKVLSVAQLIPVPDAEDFMVRPVPVAAPRPPPAHPGRVRPRRCSGSSRTTPSRMGLR